MNNIETKTGETKVGLGPTKAEKEAAAKKQALARLIMKYSFFISTDKIPETPEQIKEIDEMQAAIKALLTVADLSLMLNGIGISNERKEKLFVRLKIFCKPADGKTYADEAIENLQLAVANEHREGRSTPPGSRRHPTLGSWAAAASRGDPITVPMQTGWTRAKVVATLAASAGIVVATIALNFNKSDSDEATAGQPTAALPVPKDGAVAARVSATLNPPASKTVAGPSIMKDETTRSAEDEDDGAEDEVAEGETAGGETAGGETVGGETVGGAVAQHKSIQRQTKLQAVATAANAITTASAQPDPINTATPQTTASVKASASEPKDASPPKDSSPPPKDPPTKPKTGADDTVEPWAD